MPTTLLSSPQDMRWLRDTHTKIAKGYKMALLHGNEDCPTKIELFARDHYQCKPTVLVYVPDLDAYILSETGETPNRK